MKQKTMKLIVRIVAGFMALLMIGSIFLLTGCSKQETSSESSSINPEDYEPSWDDSKLTERDLTVQVGEDEVGDCYMITVDWQNPDAKPAVTVSAPDETSFDPHTANGSSATFAIPNFEPGVYTVHISGYGLGQLSIMSYAYTGEIQDLELEATETESELMNSIKGVYQDAVPTDLQAKLKLISTNETLQTEIPFGYPADSEGYFCFNPDEAFAFMLIDAKSQEQADNIAMSAMDYVQAEMASHADVKYNTQCWAVGNFAAFLLTPVDFDFNSMYLAMNQFMLDNTETETAESVDETSADTTPEETPAEETPVEDVTTQDNSEPAD